MIVGHWSVAFTIVVDDIHVDFMELSQTNQVDILSALLQGITNGEIIERPDVSLIQTAS